MGTRLDINREHKYLYKRFTRKKIILFSIKPFPGVYDSILFVLMSHDKNITNEIQF